jgi:hypothetical protein
MRAKLYNSFSLTTSQEKALLHEDSSEHKSLDKDVALTDSDTDSERTSYSIKICGYCTQARHSECLGALIIPAIVVKKTIRYYSLIELTLFVVA